MKFFGKTMTAAIGALALSGTLLVPSSVSFASPGPALTPPAAEVPPAPVLPVAMPEAALEAPAAPPVVVDEPAAPVEAANPPEPRRVASTEMDDDLECLAKVVLHEAGNQSREGQIAVAEVVMNRLNDTRRRFGRSICGVILQRGQFFNVHTYHPQGRDRRWSRAVEIARSVRDGEAGEVTNGALFFRAPHGAPFRGRTRTTTIGGHHFYR